MTFSRILLLTLLFLPSAFAEDGSPEIIFEAKLPGTQPEEPKPENPCKPEGRGGQDGGHTGGNPCVPKDK